MEEILEKVVGDLQLDKSKWSLIKFGDVAIQQKKSVDRDNTDLKIYVKGEHMGSEDLHLREWGELTDEYLGPAFIRKFEEGDILYGSRRTYLRKVVIAPFSGITSNTTFVIKANEKHINKRLLPFIMMSEGFTENSIRNSKGSVNPYINWKDIANYEFLIPPKDLQAKLAELLWAMDEVVESEIKTKLTIKNYLDSVSGRIFSRRVSSFLGELPFDIASQNWINCCLDDLCELVTDGAHASPKTVEGGYPIGTVENMLEDKIDVPSCRTIGLEDFNYLKRNNCKPQLGDILFSKDGTIGKTFVFNQPEDLILLSSIAIIRTKKNLLISDYCSLMLESPVFITEIEKRKSGTALKRVVLKDIKKFRINLPSVEFQTDVASYLNSLKLNIRLLESQIATSHALQKSLINQIF